MVVDKLQDHKLCKTPEGIAIWLTAKSQIPNLSFPTQVWKRENPLDRKEKSSLAKILREGTLVGASHDASEPKASQQGIWSTKVHFVWDVVITKFLEVRPAQKASKEKKTLSFKDFWEECVDSKSCVTD